MGRFLDQLRVRTVPEIASEYIDYGQWKAKLRQHISEQAELSRAKDSDDEGAQCTDDESEYEDEDDDEESGLDLMLAEDKFFGAFVGELTRMQAFYRTQLDVIRQRHQAIAALVYGKDVGRTKKKRLRVREFARGELNEIRRDVMGIKELIERLKNFIAANVEVFKRISRIHDAVLKNSKGKEFLKRRVYQSSCYRCKAVFVIERKINEVVFAASTSGKAPPLDGSSPLMPHVAAIHIGAVPKMPVPRSTSTGNFASILSGEALHSETYSVSLPSLEKVSMIPPDSCLNDYLKSVEPGTFRNVWVPLLEDATGSPECVPVMIAKGRGKGPILGLTAALHGNELNGIPLIFRLFRELELETFCGTLVAVTVTNVAGYRRSQRGYKSGEDLNRLFPGKATGASGQRYVASLLKNLITTLDFLVDLHTASFGRVNSLYVRADMNDSTTARMAIMQNPQIVVHNTGPDGSLRGAAAELGIPAITVEIGNPQIFQRRFVKHALVGVSNILSFLGMLVQEIEPPEVAATICTRSFWIFTDCGGILEVFPALCDLLEEGQLIAEIRDLFGRPVKRYYAPCKGIIIGKNGNPAAETGARIVHFGVTEGHYADTADDGHL